MRSGHIFLEQGKPIFYSKSICFQVNQVKSSTLLPYKKHLCWTVVVGLDPTLCSFRDNFRNCSRLCCYFNVSIASSFFIGRTGPPIDLSHATQIPTSVFLFSKPIQITFLLLDIGMLSLIPLSCYRI